MATLTRQEQALAETAQGGDVLRGGIREAARRLGVGERRAYRIAKSNGYPFSLFCIRIGSVYVVPRSAFERFLAGELNPNDGTKAGAR